MPSPLVSFAARIRGAGLLWRLYAAGVGVSALLVAGAGLLADARLIEIATALVQARAVDQIELGVKDRVLPADFEPPYTDGKLERLATGLAPLLARMGPGDGGIILLKVYARDSTILFTDVLGRRGEVRPARPGGLRSKALEGSLGSKLISPSDPELADVPGQQGTVLETYVPLILNGRVVAVYEIYQDLRLLDQLHLILWGTGAGALILAWLALGALTHLAGVLTRRHQEAREQLAREAVALEQSRSAEERLRTLYEAIACGVVVQNSSGTIIHVNQAAEEIFGRRADQMAGQLGRGLWQTWREDGTEMPWEERPSQIAIRSRQAVHKVTVRLSRPDGSSRWTQVDAVPILGQDGQPLQVVASFIDITERKEAQEALALQALHDALTGLPNRTLFYDRATQAILSSRRAHTTLSVLSLDLDRFKVVNDALGHQAGDVVLREVAQRLARAVRSSDTIARLGGDEFAVLLPATDAAGAGVAAEKLLETLKPPFVVEGHSFAIGASIGAALCPVHGQEIEPLLHNADVAMYTAKRGGGGFGVYSPNHSGRP